MLKEISKGDHHNPYTPNTCEHAVYHTIAYRLTLRDYIKISSVANRCLWKYLKDGKNKPYSKKTIGAALINLMNDGYLKFDSKTTANEHLYIQKGQVKE